MEQEHDYQKACEILQQALRDADRILRRANLRVSMQFDREDGQLVCEKDENDPA